MFKVKQAWLFSTSTDEIGHTKNLEAIYIIRKENDTLRTASHDACSYPR